MKVNDISSNVIIQRMKPAHYRLLGWACLLIPAAFAFHSCINETAIAGWMFRNSERLLGTRLTQISWLLTFALLCLPGYLAKRFFDDLAWNATVNSMPPPDPHESARRSKYVKVNPVLTPVAAPAIDVKKAQAAGQEFIATCKSCGQLFPVTAQNASPACPTCGEPLSQE